MGKYKKCLCSGIGLVLMVFLFTMVSTQVKAEEFRIEPSQNDKASAPAVGYNNTYIIATFGKTEDSDSTVNYVKFTTPTEVGYTTLELTNCGITSSPSAAVYTEEGRKIHTFTSFTSDQTLRMNGVLSANTTYYVAITVDANLNLNNPDTKRNMSLELSMRKDAEGDTKSVAVPVATKSSQNWTIDGNGDKDCATFTAVDTGKIRLAWVNNTLGTLSAELRKCSSDEKIFGDTAAKDVKKVWELNAQAGESYYLQFSGNGYVMKYTFTLSDVEVTGIALSETQKTVSIGDQFTLKATLSPDGAYNRTLKYSSSDTKVAIVDAAKGTVKAVASGKAVITCSTARGEVVTQTCTVYVKPQKAGTVTRKQASSTTSKIKFGWAAISGAEGYEVALYNCTTKKWTTLPETFAKPTLLTVKKLSSKVNYQVKIRAFKMVDGQKLYGDYSPVCKISTKPAKVKIKKIRRLSSSSVEITIKKVKGVSGYQVHRTLSKKGFFGTIKNVKAKTTKIKVKGLGKRLKYYFKIRAYKKYDSVMYYGAWSKKYKK